ncbi:hypothetical protein Droror1_Dr00007881 [Drosera rotundifolia]
MDPPQPLDPSLQSPTQPQTLAAGDDMIACVIALEAALLPCLPARELQAIDRSSHPSHQSNSFYRFAMILGYFSHMMDEIFNQPRCCASASSDVFEVFYLHEALFNVFDNIG